MRSDAADTTGLCGLIETAYSAALRLGGDAANVAELLATALTQARNIAANGGHPDEGLAPADLTTENDR